MTRTSKTNRHGSREAIEKRRVARQLNALFDENEDRIKARRTGHALNAIDVAYADEISRVNGTRQPRISVWTSLGRACKAASAAR